MNVSRLVIAVVGVPAFRWALSAFGSGTRGDGRLKARIVDLAGLHRTGGQPLLRAKLKEDQSSHRGISLN